MNKLYITLIALLLVGGVSALIVTSNGYILNRNEMAGVGDSTIANYMTNAFGLADYKIMEDKIITYYNVTYLEPYSSNGETKYRVFTQYKPFQIQKSLWNKCVNLTSQSACIDYLVNRETPFVHVENISYQENVTYYNNVSYEEEVTYYNQTEVINEVEVVDEFGNITIVNETSYIEVPYNVTETYYVQEPYQIEETKYRTENTTITSTYYQAKQEQLNQYARAKIIRDNAIDNELDYLFENMVGGI